MKIYPSLAAADPLTLGQTIANMESTADGFHLDIMDFHFVPNVSFGPNTINSIDRACTTTSFAHLMVDNPEAWLEVLKLKNGSCVAFHPSTTPTPKALIEKITARGWLPAIALLPHETASMILPFATQIHAVIVLCVAPGFSGQEMEPSAAQNIHALDHLRAERQLPFQIVADGGINEKTIATIKQAGADSAVVGAGIFGQPNPLEALQHLKKIAA